MNTEKKTFYKVASVAAVLSAMTTFLLWLLPKFALKAETFDQTILLASDVFYMAKQWVNFIHIFFALLAYYGLSVSLKKSPFSKLGFYSFLLWGFTELLGVSMIIFALNKTWRLSYAGADELTKSLLTSNINMFMALWDGMFFLLLVAFFVANLIFGFLLLKGGSIAKLLGALFFLGAILTVFIMLGGYTSHTWTAPITNSIYPVLQPLSRLVLGVYLWKVGTTINLTR